MKTKRLEILICDDDHLFRVTLAKQLESYGNMKTCKNSKEAKTLLEQKSYDLLCLDIQMESDKEGLNFIPIAKAIHPSLYIMMMSGLTDYQTVKEAIFLGADDYLGKNFEKEELEIAIRKMQTLRKLKDQNAHFQNKEQKNQIQFIGSSQKLKTLQTQIEKFKKATGAVLIEGETGTGKESCAKLLRKQDAEGNLEPFIAIDSSTLHSQLAESILFGHEKGSFTGADQSKKGLFEEADGGIVFFDEIGNMPLQIQMKLLRVLQEKEIMRVGSTKAIPCDFRVVSATNKNLENQVQKGEFMDDLYQRLNVLPLKTPPLRERKEDLQELCEFFIQEASPHKKHTFKAEVIELFKKYDWPGNIRELKNAVSYAVSVVDESQSEIDLSCVRQSILDACKEKPNTSTALNEPLNELRVLLYETEKNFLSKCYQHYDGNISKMAQKLELDRSHLFLKLKKWGIHQVKS